jgi:2-oxo-4-hydroxy-4-carboxy--5-ureidoimidazoline (OHCU) decarboxylase
MPGKLTASSTQEQASAGLNTLTKEEINFFQTNNEAYKSKFGFPFIICVRLNKKEGIMSAMPVRYISSFTATNCTACKTPIQKNSTLLWSR